MSKIFPSRVDSLSVGASCALEQKGSHKSCLPCKGRKSTNYMYIQSPLTMCIQIFVWLIQLIYEAVSVTSEMIVLCSPDKVYIIPCVGISSARHGCNAFRNTVKHLYFVVILFWHYWWWRKKNAKIKKKMPINIKEGKRRITNWQKLYSQYWCGCCPCTCMLIKNLIMIWSDEYTHHKYDVIQHESVKGITCEKIKHVFTSVALV